MFTKKQKIGGESRKNKWDKSKDSQGLKALIVRLETITAAQHEHNGTRLKADDYLLAAVKKKTKLEKVKALSESPADYKRANVNHYGKTGTNLGDFWKKDKRTKTVTARH